LINTADGLTFRRGGINALSCGWNTARAGWLTAVTAVGLTAGNIIAAVDAACARAFSGGQISATTIRQTAGALNRFGTVYRRAVTAGCENAVNIRALGRQVGHEALTSRRNTTSTVDYADTGSATGTITHVIAISRGAILRGHLNTARKQAAGAGGQLYDAVHPT
jgi:hypothetical protein